MKRISLMSTILAIALSGCGLKRINDNTAEGNFLEKSKAIPIITIGMMGDVMLGRTVDEHINILKQKNAQAAFLYPWGNTVSLLKKNHLNLINLETAITYFNKPVPKVFNFKASPSNIAVLKEGHVSVVNLANNHILDFGEAGLKESLATLKSESLPYVGAGLDRDEARRMHIKEIDGVRIGIVGATDNEPGWQAAPGKPGTNYVQVGDRVAVEDWIKKAKSQVDLLILSIHWGPNNRERPSEDFKSFAHFLIDSGVDVIHGHSAHIFQGIERYEHGLIIYDSGDFIDDYRIDPVLRNDRSFLFVLELEGKRPSRFIMHPVLIDNMQVNLIAGDEAHAAMTRMIQLSKELGTKVDSREGYLELKL